MLDKFKDTIVDNIVQKRNSRGIKVDAETLKAAVSNSPQILQKIEEIFQSDSKDKFTQITTLITQAAKGEFTSTSSHTTKE